MKEVVNVQQFKTYYSRYLDLKSKIGKLKINFDAIDIEISEGRLLELRFDTLVVRQFVNQQNLKTIRPIRCCYSSSSSGKTYISDYERLSYIELRNYWS